LSKVSHRARSLCVLRCEVLGRGRRQKAAVRGTSVGEGAFDHAEARAHARTVAVRLRRHEPGRSLALARTLLGNKARLGMRAPERAGPLTESKSQGDE
jgi:hypothetical protein